jgi:hypothetical protein
MQSEFYVNRTSDYSVFGVDRSMQNQYLACY